MVISGVAIVNDKGQVKTPRNAAEISNMALCYVMAT
jgi:hypothetical protein